MTTQNVHGIDALRKQVNNVADDVRKRDEEVRREADRINAQRAQDARDAAIAARLIDQHHADQLVDVDEEARQLAGILDVSVSVPAPAPSAATHFAPPAPAPVAPIVSQPDPPSASKVVDWSLDDNNDDVPPPPPVAPRPAKPTPVVIEQDDPDLYTRAQLMEMSNDILAELARFWEIRVNNDGIRRVALVELIVSAQSDWCLEHDFVDPNAPLAAPLVETRRISVYDPRKWHPVQWVFALLFALLFFGIAMLTRAWPDFGGFPRGLYAFVWVIVVSLFGFFLGGVLGGIVRPDDSNDE